VISLVTATLLAGSDVEGEDYETVSVSVSCSLSNQSTEMFSEVQSETYIKVSIFVLSMHLFSISKRKYNYRNLMTTAVEHRISSGANRSLPSQ